MLHLDEYDLVILGSGQSGKYLARTLASQGKHVAVIEREYIGGSCNAVACLPSKNVIHSAKVVSYFRRSAEFGIAKGPWKVEMSGVRDRKRKMVDDLNGINRQRYSASGAELVMGQGRFVGPKTIEVRLADGGTRILRGQTVAINTGTRAKIDAWPPGVAAADTRRSP